MGKVNVYIDVNLHMTIFIFYFFVKDTIYIYGKKIYQKSYINLYMTL